MELSLVFFRILSSYKDETRAHGLFVPPRFTFSPLPRDSESLPDRRPNRHAFAWRVLDHESSQHGVCHTWLHHCWRVQLRP